MNVLDKAGGIKKGCLGIGMLKDFCVLKPRRQIVNKLT